jgi:hypothetical protein
MMCSLELGTSLQWSTEQPLLPAWYQLWSCNAQPIEGCNLLAMLHDTVLVVADVSVVHSAAQTYVHNAARTNGVAGGTAAMAGVEMSTVEFED